MQAEYRSIKVAQETYDNLVKLVGLISLEGWKSIRGQRQSRPTMGAVLDELVAAALRNGGRK